MVLTKDEYRSQRDHILLKHGSSHLLTDPSVIELLTISPADIDEKANLRPTLWSKKQFEPPFLVTCDANGV
jgi:hypothetical protein